MLLHKIFFIFLDICFSFFTKYFAKISSKYSFVFGFDMVKYLCLSSSMFSSTVYALDVSWKFVLIRQPFNLVFEQNTLNYTTCSKA